MANRKLVDGGGPVLTRAKIVLSFRGSGWTTGTFSTSDARRAFEATLDSPYLSHLVQYRGIRRAEIVFSTEDTSNIGTLGPDPRHFVAGNIWLVPDEDIRNVVRDAVRVRPPQDNEEVFYLVVISQDPIPIVPEVSDASGYHNTFEENGRTIVFGVLLNQSANSAEKTWHYLPGIFSHELVEACTDPNVTSGYRFEDGNEICDLDEDRPVELLGLGREVTLAAYWSDLEEAAVVPTTYSLRVALGKRSTEVIPSVRAAIQGTSVRNTILAGCNS